MNNLPSINAQILEHEVSNQEWQYSNIAKDLINWIEKFRSEFNLDFLPKPCLKIDLIHPLAYGTYRFGFNDIGTQYEISINSLYLKRPFWDVLRTLLHEILHQREEFNGYKIKNKRGQYHSSAYRDTAKEFGIPCNKWGQNLGLVKGGPFHNLLVKHGVNLEEIKFYDEDDKEVEKRVPTRKGKLRKWHCSCNQPVNIWAARGRELKITCNECLALFERDPEI